VGEAQGPKAAVAAAGCYAEGMSDGTAAGDQRRGGGGGGAPLDLAVHGETWFRFQNPHYQRHSQRRLEHLATLGLPLAGRRVLEVGAGIGDHTSFFADRGCEVVTTEARAENLAVLEWRHPALKVRALDLDAPDAGFEERFEVVFCYGTLYHLARPAEALAWLAGRCDALLLLETCVLPVDEERVVFHDEPREASENSVSGRGCRPSRAWVAAQLRRDFAHVYLPVTQPWHEEFPLDWTVPPPNPFLVRAVFVASRTPLDSPLLAEEIPARQRRAG
jgi:SAM-dependent methyltransferase